MALQYHSGQIEVQEEANTRPAAEMLAHWIGPVGLFASVADMIVLATPQETGELQFAAVSGAAPLVDVVGDSAIRLPHLELPYEADGGLAGGIAISLAQLRRARLNGRLWLDEGGWTLEAEEAFTNCRKYLAPSVAVSETPHAGPVSRQRISISDSWLREVVGRAETSFLASISPDGQPDVSHRGGLPGFLSMDAGTGRVRWDEYVGDGMLKSAGNVRATGSVALLVLDLATGDAAELAGRAEFTTLRRYKEARQSALEQHREQYPVQGAMEMRIDSAYRLTGLTSPRRRLDKALSVTSKSTTDQQAPQ
jgi:hypothetical protein